MPLDISRLDPDQRAAVTAGSGPVLVFAGAGSGKTRTLTARVAWLLDRGVTAHSIMAVTFTRKAADEMRERLRRLLGPEGDVGALRVGTFHAQMAVALRREPPEVLARLGRSRNFTVWDEDDRERAVGRLVKERCAGVDGLSAGGVAELISRWKNADADFESVTAAARSIDEHAAARLWPAYEDAARSADAFDFDDLLLAPLRLLRDDADLRRRWSGAIAQLLVDEFQDTNAVQLELVAQLSSVNGNLFVVGDDAQSIYSFRGAQIENILRFRDRYPSAQVFTLRSNYRSTQQICDLANLILTHNKNNIQKELKAGGKVQNGPRPTFRRFGSEYDEARFVAGVLARLDRPAAAGVLVRQNRQTRVLELALSEAGIPYRVLGGTAFWSREEVRDLVAWLRVVANPRDSMAWRRVLAKPGRRGIGDGLIDAVATAAAGRGGDWLGGLGAVGAGREGTAKGRANLISTAGIVRSYAEQAERLLPRTLVAGVLSDCGLLEFHDDGSDEGTGRVENLREVTSAAASYASGELRQFLESATLDSETGQREAPAESVSLATLHAAKGLEWDIVIIAGCEEGLLPHANSNEPDEIDEERRLFYVGATRARRQLLLTAAATRLTNGQRLDRATSRFIREARAAIDIPGQPVPSGRPTRPRASPRS